MERKYDFCMIQTEGKYFYYDFVLCTCYPFSFQLFTLLNNNYDEKSHLAISELKRILPDLHLFTDYEIKFAIKQLKYFRSKLTVAHKELSFYEYPSFTRKEIIESLAHTKQIILELTEKCNLSCRYCCYGNLYNAPEHWKPEYQGKDDDQVSYLKAIFELKKNLLNHDQNQIYITFYGGEPLLKIDSIKKVLDEVPKMLGNHVKVQYTMTTNALLLDKYIDLLVKYNFKIYVSLDGNRENDRYRCFNDGKESFYIVERNLQNIQRKYPEFFENNISFVSVLHNKNNCLEVCDYFKNYHKSTSFSFLSKENLNPETLSEFTKMSQNHSYTVDELKEIEDKYPSIFEIYFSETKICNHVFRIDQPDNITDLFKRDFITRGKSCELFEDRVFVTTNGLLLLCEKSHRKYCFGNIKNGKISVYTKRINRYYNQITSAFQEICSDCNMKTNCEKCFFQTSNFESVKHCYKDLSRIKDELVNIVKFNEATL